MLGVDDLVQVAQEGDGFDVLAAAEAVGHPLAGLSRVVEVEHRRDRVDAQAVEVELLDPEQRARDEEVGDLVAAVVEDQRAPVLVLAEPRILVLVERGAVEAGEAVRVLREVAGHPVEDHADAVAVALVDEPAEVVGRAVPAGRREEAGDLVAPRAAERVLQHRHAARCA